MFFLIIIFIFIFAVSNREQKGVFNLLNRHMIIFTYTIYMCLYNFYIFVFLYFVFFSIFLYFLV